MPVIEIENLDLPDLKSYTGLASGSTENSQSDSSIIVESPKVINTALDCGVRPISLLCERKHISGDAMPVIERCKEINVYTGTRELLKELTGYTLTRGVLCEMHRPVSPEAKDILANAKRICVIYDICDSTNIGAIFRTAAALGIDGILVSPQSCDPFNRRSIRVSMGAVFRIPWCFCHNIIDSLREKGFKSISMALNSESIFLQDFKTEKDGKYAVLFGSEGYGLPEHIIDESVYTVKIPMYNNVDSLNVGAAAAIALWHFRESQQ